MDLPNQDPQALQQDLQHLAGLNRTFGARRRVAALFRHFSEKMQRVLLVDLASGYCDHARNLIAQGRTRHQEVAVVAVDFQFETLRIARRATPKGDRILFVQADARKLPLRSRGADLTFCSLALHHFSNEDALTVLKEMKRVARVGEACIDLVRSRLATIGIWLLTTFIVRDPMVRHDARVSIHRAFTAEEMRDLASRAGWTDRQQKKFLWFQQAILGHRVDHA